MDQKKILSGFDELGLAHRLHDPYDGALSYSQRFEKCSVYKDTAIEYSSDSRVSHVASDKDKVTNLNY